MHIIKELPELLKANIISQETVDNIESYYRNKKDSSSNLLFTIFGVLGALLVSLGIILILAHNWDEFTRTTKTILAFVPLIGGQIIAAFTLIKKKTSKAWRESSSAFLFFAIASSISLVSQIYHIPGNLSSFIFIWMLLSLPLIYLMKSSITSIFYIIGITYYALEKSYFNYPGVEPFYYWLMLLAALPHYYMLLKNNANNNFTIIHNWLIPITLVFTLGTYAHTKETIMFTSYFSMFSLFYIIGRLPIFNKKHFLLRSYLIIGSIGFMSILLIFTFYDVWDDYFFKNNSFINLINSQEFIVSAIITIITSAVLVLRWIKYQEIKINLLEPLFLVFYILFYIGLFGYYPVFIINLIVFAIGIYTIWDGVKKNHLGILNFGLLIITALVICRFFDTELSFIYRGIMFISVGFGFFITNYKLLQQRKSNNSKITNNEI